MAQASRINLTITAQDATAQAFASVRRSMDGLNRSLAAVRGGLAGFGVALSAGAALNFAKASLASAAALGDMAERVGITTSRLQDYRAAALQSGASVDQLDTALTRFAVQLGEAAKGVGNASDGFDALGIDIRDSAGKLRSVDDVWRSFADRIKAIQDPAERAAAIADVLGEKAGPRLATMLAQGSAGFDEAGQKIAEWGGKVSEETVKAAQAFDNFAAAAGMTLKAWAATAAAEAPGLAERMFSPYLNWLTRLGHGMADLGRGVRVDRSGGQPSPGPKPPTPDILPAAPAPEPRLTAKQRGELAEAFVKGEEMAAADVFGAQVALNENQKRLEDERLERHRAYLASLVDQERMAADDTQGARDAVAQQDARRAAEARQIWEETLTPLERYNEEMDRLRSLHEQGAISSDVFNRAVIKTSEQLNGAVRSTSDSTRQLDGIASSLGLTFSSAFEDAIVSGKKFGDVLKGLAQDMMRLFTRKLVTEPLFNSVFGQVLGPLSLFGGGASQVNAAFNSPALQSSIAGVQGGFFAEGGRPPVGLASLVGERGPELFVPDRPGTVVPNDALGGVTVNQTIQISTGVAQTVRAEILGMLPRIKAETVAAVADARQRGGRFAAAFA